MSLLSRRDMLAGLGALAFSTGLPQSAGATGDTPTLIVILLRGGMDGLSALMPVGEADFFRLRPGVIAETSRPLLDGLFSLHPNSRWFPGSLMTPGNWQSSRAWRRPIVDARIATLSKRSMAVLEKPATI